MKESVIRFFSWYRKLSLGVHILMGMVLGIALGVLLGEKATLVKPVGDLFLKLLLMSAIPLVFFNLISGITSLSDIRILGRIGIRTLVYYLVTTTIALVLALIMANGFRPGEGMQLSQEVGESFGEIPSVVSVILDLFPENILPRSVLEKSLRSLCSRYFSALPRFCCLQDKRGNYRSFSLCSRPCCGDWSASYFISGLSASPLWPRPLWVSMEARSSDRSPNLSFPSGLPSS